MIYTKLRNRCGSLAVQSDFFFIVLGACLVAAAIALNVSWVVINPRGHNALLVLGIIFFLVIIAGLVVNTIFLVLEIRRSERQDSFLNAVTRLVKKLPSLRSASIWKPCKRVHSRNKNGAISTAS